MQLGVFRIDFAPLSVFFSQSPLDIILQLFALGGWAIFAYLLLFAGIELLKGYRADKHTAHWKWVLLAVDVPLLNVQTPKAVEQMFNHLSGAYDGHNIEGTFVHGHKQQWFSFEIISIEGYIQFLIRTEETFRDLVETALYAQYPDAQITEVEDYVTATPDKFPNDQYDMWAADFGLTESDAYPIRTYRDFEHSISKDTVLKDPMGAFLESFSRLGPGEQMWFQILIEPIDGHWKHKSIDKIKEVIGDKSGHGHGGSGIGGKIADFVTDTPMKFLVGVGDQIFGREASEGGHDEHSDDGEPNQLRYLTPGQTKVVEDMETKITHVGFKTKMRGVYLARKEVFHPSRGVNALIGAISQFNVPTSNSIVPTFGVGASYFFKDKRSAEKKNLLMKAYKKRKIKVGSNPYVLNSEELATIWHFPMSHVKTPLLQKTEGKRAEPPAGLPTERIFATAEEKPRLEAKKTYQTDSGDGNYPEGMKFG